MSSPKRHHYLPQCFLRNFGTDNGVWVYNRKKNDIRWQKVKDTCLINYFYSIEYEDGGRDDSTFEKMFSSIESSYADIHKRLTLRENLSHKHISDICLFVSYMMNRTPDFHDGIQLVESKLIKSFTEQIFNSDERIENVLMRFRENNPEIKIDASDYEIMREVIKNGNFNIKIHRNRSLELMTSLSRSFAKILCGLNISILHAPKDSSFLTTDRPFVILPPKDRSFIPKWAGIGLRTPGARKILPLSAKLLIMFGDAGRYFHHIDISKNDVMRFNAWICETTKDFLIGRDRPLVERWVRRLNLSERVPIPSISIG